jgi:uncharacterized damage-inducible protein DinB
MLPYLQKLFAYDHWANREVLASLRAADPPALALKLLGHIVGTEWLYLSRLRGTRSPMAVWPELTREQCSVNLDQLQRLWQDMLHELTPGRLSTRVSYVNSKGERWENTFEDMLVHVVLHSAYHRGQLALDLRTAGRTPPYTDFIHCVRQGLID